MTLPDINSYIKGKFYSNPGFRALQGENPEYCLKLVEQIAQKSEGVFLWVTLVVGILMGDLTNGSRISDLQKHLEELPSDLEDFYDIILSSIPKEHFTHASQLFQLVHTAVKPLSLLELSFLGDDPNKVTSLPIRPFPRDQANFRTDRMRRRIHHSCRGLLETGCPLEGDLSRITVQYLHRTVKDFIGSPSVQARLIAATGSDFDPYSALALATLTTTKVVSDISWTTVLQCISYADLSAKNSGTDHSFLTFIMDRLPDVIRAHKLNVPTHDKYPLGPKGGISCPEGFSSWAVRFQLNWYLEAALAKGLPTQASGGKRHPLLGCSVVEYVVRCHFNPEEYAYFDAPNIHIGETLLGAGADPNEKVGAGNDWTVWDMVVQYILDVIEVGPSGKNFSLWIKIGILFLNYGADTSRESAEDILHKLKLLSPALQFDSGLSITEAWTAGYRKADKVRKEKRRNIRSSRNINVAYREGVDTTEPDERVKKNRITTRVLRSLKRVLK